MKRITLPEGLVSIGTNAFWGCRSLKSLNFPQTLSSIGLRAFHECISLTEVSVGSLTQWLDLKFPSIDRADYEDTFPFCASGEGHLLISGKESVSVIIPEGYTEIREYAFFNCQSITEVNIPCTTKRVGDGAFGGCTNLTRVHLPNLQHWVDLNYSGSFFLSSHEGHIYASGDEIKEVTVPESVSSFGFGAFSYCTGLECIILEPILPPAIGAYAFRGISCPVYVWEGCIDVYLSDPTWKDCWILLKVNPNMP